jgi:hypothetical protein
MRTSVYKINKGINKPIEFRGLKAQYIGYLGGGLVLLLILFALLYVIGVNPFICLALVLTLATALFAFIYRMSNTYGQHGLLKSAARKQIPAWVSCTSRKGFLNLKQTSR